MHIRPAPGLIVRDPKTKQPLPAAGREVTPSIYWTRRLTAGDVVLVPPAPAPKAAQKEKP